MAARLTALAVPKCMQQRALAARPDAGDLVERIAHHLLLAPRPVRADGEAMRLVAQALDEIEHRIAHRQAEGLAAAHEEALAAGLAVLALGDADGRDAVRRCRDLSRIVRTADIWPWPPSMRMRSGQAGKAASSASGSASAAGGIARPASLA